MASAMMLSSTRPPHLETCPRVRPGVWSAVAQEDRLRRTRSIASSHHTTSSGHQRDSTSTDPFATKQQAEVAALEAYNRAHRYEGQACRPATHLQRRRSQTTGRTEGSYFEDARLGRRRSTSTKGESRPPQSRRSQQPPTVNENTTDSAGEERVVTRKRSVIPPSSAVTQAQHDNLAVPSTTSQRTRKPQSVYADGSPVPRRPVPLAQRSSTLQLSSTPTSEHTDGRGGNAAHLADFGKPTVTAHTSELVRPSIRETQTDEEILTLARDRCLQDFQQKRVRERKSFILAPFQKRRATNHFTTSDSSYDTTLPPFNYAGEGTRASLPHLSEPFPMVPVTITKSASKPRNFSETLKGRIKKVFRKASSAPSGLPAQHVQAKHSHYGASEEAPLTIPSKIADPFVGVSEDTLIAATKEHATSTNSRSSGAQSRGAQSRVTSWATSTAAGTCKSRAEAAHPGSVEEHGGLVRTKSVSTLRKAKSFFGKPVQNRLRRPSKAELSTSEESQALYNALQQRMRPAKRTPTPDDEYTGDGIEASRSRVSSGLASLPSQQQANDTVSSNKRYRTPTIRSVTPDPKAYHLRICSPVAEVLSPAYVAVEHASRRAPLDEHSEASSEQTLLQRRRAIKAPAPSREQLQRRVEKSKNRWQSPLDELSPHPARADMDENPYELRSINQSLQQPHARNDLPHHAKIGEHVHFVGREAMLSPSVYSRASDGASPQPFVPLEESGMVVTITGREVKSYAISPPKQELKQRPAQTSGQWRRWLSDEMSGFRSAGEDFSLAQAFLNGAAADRSRSIPAEQTGLGDEPRRTSIVPHVDNRPPSTANSARRDSTATGRPRASSRRSSFMNERYPIVDSLRNSSGESITSWNLRSRAGSSSEREHTVQSISDRQIQRQAVSRNRVVTSRASIAQMQSITTHEDGETAENTTQEHSKSGALPRHDDKPTTALAKHSAPLSEHQAKKANKHKSAYELRANYKSSSTGRSTPLEIRRRPTPGDTANMLEDNTIRNISAGPYAAHHVLAARKTSTHGHHTTNDNKENTSPAPDTGSGLPALSSSEWLATGAPKKSRTPSAVHPAYRKRSVSRYSPPKGGVVSGGGGGGGKGSPAQRMASEWLEKRSRESTPAFV
ncbi:hypothetical protein LTR35_008903 [Friedmanniomyces endolithicus]|uniref:Uncharacterized protein n=1 Tax=Friedmanniomyces endolithicus TaxID=329885 RepID=A0AAN6FPA7_9PEZI|nr:hypothetical protein LTR35_008903 [Friedmanniomyces endolithicus]KAK0294914.1 hypothetical protein LTS00_006380 [Friedmanniomyces endolithicus]KAK0319768.1 hypothetical protein LTR82_009103 [Friedmanniomyces endolithicus]KAK0985062.1 hypothetical protein LTR54_013862 [Friedmanniomyces endolithicus]